MTFYPPAAAVPEGLRTDEFLLRMLRATDVELDYDAVISSRQQLLIRSGGDWPVEGFSLAENLADLQRHEQEHLERKAFTYTVMNPTETQCLGCVYLNPLLPLFQRLNANTEEINTLQAHDAWVTFWVRQSRLAGHLDHRLLTALHSWFKHEWAFSRVFFRADEEEPAVIQMLQEAELQLYYTLQGLHGKRYFYL